MIKAMLYRVTLIDIDRKLRVDFTTATKPDSMGQANKWIHAHPNQKWQKFTSEIDDNYLN